jgi:hypothetical protein
MPVSPPSTVPERLVEMSADVRAAVLLDSAGGLIAASEDDTARARRLADLAHDMVTATDAAAGDPTEQIEAQLPAGSVFCVRSATHTLVCVAKRLALPALVLYDMRRTLLDAETPA